jgi:archaetidylinositol phosphate synthase
MSAKKLTLALANGKRIEHPAQPQTNPASNFQNAPRIQEAVTASLEKKVLIWLALRMPPWLNSDHLTLLGFASMCLACASYIFARRNRVGLLLATLCLALNWFGDSLDGTIARVRNRQRPRYGFYVDHIIDSIGALLLMGGLAASGFLDERIAMGMLVAFLLLSIETYLATYTIGTFRMSFWKFGPTEIRLLLAIGNITLWFRPEARVPIVGYRLFDFGGIVAIAGMSAMLFIAVVRNTAKLYREGL